MQVSHSLVFKQEQVQNVFVPLFSDFITGLSTECDLFLESSKSDSSINLVM